MPAIELDLTRIATIWMAGVILLVPLMGVVARFALTPLLDAAGRFRAAGAGLDEVRDQVAELRRTVAELRAEVTRDELRVTS